MTNSSHIVIVAPETLPIPPRKGGAVQTVIYEQTKRLQQFNLTILSPDEEKKSEDENINKINNKRILLSNKIINSEDRDLRRLHYLDSVLKKLKKLHPRLIHIHNRPQFVLAIRKKNPNVNIILHLHNEHLDCLPLKKQRKVLKTCNHILCVSHYLRKKIIKRHKSYKHKIVVVPNGIDISNFTQVSSPKEKKKIRRKYGFSDKDVILLYVGRIVPVKGLNKIIEALLTMDQKERKRIKLVVIGASEFGRKKRSDYENNVRKLGRRLGKQVVFTGYVDHNKLPNYYQLSDIFVAPMRWNEPFGLVIGEAAACGLPAITTRRGAIPEIAQHGKTGFLLPSAFTNKQMINMLLYLIKHPNKRTKLGSNARKNIKKRFSWEYSVKMLEKYYKKGLDIT